MSPTKERLYREATRAAALGLVINLILGISKLTGGLIGDSFALIADAVNSLGDVLTSAAVLFAFRVAQRPPDEEHPYGHARAETIAGASVALVVGLSALSVAAEAIPRLRDVHDQPPPYWTLLIAGANVLIKEALFQYKIRVGRRTGSTALIANAWDHRSDALSALAVLIGLAAVSWGGPAWSPADEIAALFVCVAILWSAGRVYLDTAHELMDVQADPELVAMIRETAESVPGVRGTQTLWARKAGLEYLVDIHVRVDPQLTVAEGHRIGHRVKDRLLEAHATLRDVLVHLEPAPETNGQSASSPQNSNSSKAS